MYTRSTCVSPGGRHRAPSRIQRPGEPNESDPRAGSQGHFASRTELSSHYYIDNEI